MPKVISRYFEDGDRARGAVDTLIYQHGLSPAIISLFDSEEGMAETHMEAGTVEAYGNKLGNGGAVVVVEAGHRPLGVARITREVLRDMGAADMGDLVEEVAVKDAIQADTSILADHPLLMTRRRRAGDTTYHMADWPIPLISRRKPKDEFAIPRHGRMAAFPIPLISKRKPKDKFAFPRHARMANWPIALLSKRKPYDKFAFPRHARMAAFPIPLLSKRKPYTKSAIPRHGRMANWPFPLLINGKTGTNSLMPGGPRMANFPMPLLSDRAPADKFAFPRHARMANFPIPLLSKRKPADKFAFPRHARMADAILPLVISDQKSEGESGGEGRRASFSSMFNMPTLIRR